MIDARRIEDIPVVFHDPWHRVATAETRLTSLCDRVTDTVELLLAGRIEVASACSFLEASVRRFRPATQPGSPDEQSGSQPQQDPSAPKR